MPVIEMVPVMVQVMVPVMVPVTVPVMVPVMVQVTAWTIFPKRQPTSAGPDYP